MIIGLTGRRGVGKSEIANLLNQLYGFRVIHPFAPGKAMLCGYYRYMGVPEAVAVAMTDGALKDTPFAEIYIRRTTHTDIAVSELGMPWASSREAMESLGWILGSMPGSPFTLPSAYARARSNVDPDTNLVVESVVYEVEQLQSLEPTLIIRVDWPHHDSGIVGQHTDQATDKIIADLKFDNPGVSVEMLGQAFDHWFQRVLKPRMECQYEVKVGDTIGSIATRLVLNQINLMKLNGLTQSGLLLVPGSTITLPQLEICRHTRRQLTTARHPVNEGP